MSFDVENSLMQARWVAAPADDDVVAQIMRAHGMPEFIARMLAARNVAADKIESFLYPKLARDFPDPLTLAGMDDAAAFVADAVVGGRKIGVFGDFDVDGATSSSLLARFLRHCGLNPPLYIPDRMKEGYGPNENALRILKDQGAEIVIMCDCGITAHNVIAEGRKIGLDIIVLDHHEAEEKLPPATHVVNPKRKDDTSGLSMLAACGVTFMLCVAVNAKLRTIKFFEKNGLAEAPLKDWLDIVALGTVCDMVPLTGVNRLIVRAGLERMAKTANPGLRALLDVSKVSGAPTPYTLGFALGPRINAGSRVHQADLGARLLSTDDPEEAKNIAWTLNDCNEQRKAMQAGMFEHAVGMVEGERLHENPVIIVGHENWHPGLSGLVAGRLKEKYGRPAVCIAYAPGHEGGMEGRGSGRSVSGVNMGAAFIDARNEGLLLKGGGHAMAAGFTILPDQVVDFSAFLTKHVTRQLAGQPAVSETVVDAVMSVRGAQFDFVNLIQQHMGPFGQGHEEPLFMLPNVRVHKADIVGKDHVRCMVSDWEGGSRMKAMAFKAADTPVGQALLKQGRDTPFHLLGHLKPDTWNGAQRVEMHITDAVFALSGMRERQMA
ncbi:MAG: single-stranded-DNA-specific exonuclease RecJ [Proteobacteria bacterium]|nr:single-stranded-DNA-specific exonuclease RecJ [Pseudomonadota bacterium]